jgi:hypothetical protein
MPLFYGARTAADLYYADLFAELGATLVLTTEDGSRGERGRVSAPLERALNERGAATNATIYACGPTPMMSAVARLATRARRTAFASLEPVMGCGMGSCYSCVVPVRQGARSHFVRSCLEGPVFDATASSGTSSTAWDIRRWRICPFSSARSARRTRSSRRRAASARRQYQHAVDLRRSAAWPSRAVLAEREGHPPPRIVETPAGMLNAIGLQGIGVHRFVAEAARAAPSRRDDDRQHLRIDARRYWRSRACSDREGVGAIELNVSCRTSRRRHPVRLQPDRHLRRRQRRAQVRRSR